MPHIESRHAGPAIPQEAGREHVDGEYASHTLMVRAPCTLIANAGQQRIRAARHQIDVDTLGGECARHFDGVNAGRVGRGQINVAEHHDAPAAHRLAPPELKPPPRPRRHGGAGQGAPATSRVLAPTPSPPHSHTSALSWIAPEMRALTTAVTNKEISKANSSFSVPRAARHAASRRAAIPAMMPMTLARPT